MRLEGKTALITGGGSGIGAATARRFAEEGAQVVVMGRRKEPLEQVAAGTGGLAVVGDATKTDDVRAAVRTAVDRFGKLDVLVAAAGVLVLGPAGELDDQAWAGGVNANLTAAFVSAREALPALVESRGSIVLLTSLAGLGGAPSACAYTTAKHAIIGLTRSLARDYGPQGVRVNAVAPGFVRTAMADVLMDFLGERDGISREEAYLKATAETPLGRPAEPAEIASVCAFLASEDASIVTGAVVPADAGVDSMDAGSIEFVRGGTGGFQTVQGAA